MCGIAGIVSYSEGLKLTDKLVKMSHKMERRGPDDSGYLLVKNCQHYTAFDEATNESVKHNKSCPYFPLNDINSFRDGNFSFGVTHRRLSILDLSENGHQPMCDITQNYWIAYNGEVYNYGELKTVLIEKGYSFYGTSDTEVLLKAYIEWGEDFVPKLNGMFSIVLIDLNLQKILFIRDRLGIKPLYFFNGQSSFIFASDISSILSSELCSREVDWQGLFHNFSLGVCPRPNTAFKGVNSFEKGSITTLNLKNYSLTTKKYWEVPIAFSYSNGSKEEIVEELESLLTDSVKIRSIADVPISSFMSGGIDSTVISSMAAKANFDLTSYTLGFDRVDNSMDETDEAIATAAMYSMKHVVHNFSTFFDEEDLDSMVECYEEPYHDISPNFLMSKFVNSKGGKVVLNGLGGDELFAGYGYYKWLTLWSTLKQNKWLYTFIPNVFSGRKINKLKTANNMAEYFVQRHESFSHEEKLKLFNLNRPIVKTDSLIFNQYLKEREFISNIDSLGYLDINCYIGDHHLYRGDKFSMNFSLESRFPLLDHRIVELASRIPPSLKYKYNNQKYILREVAKKYIHRSCLNMKKKGFGLPRNSIIRGELNFKMIEAQRHLGSFEQFSNEGLKYFFDNGSMKQIWHLIMTSLWLKKFNLS